MGKPDSIFMLSSILLLALLGRASCAPATSLTVSEMTRSFDQNFKKILNPRNASLSTIKIYIQANFTGKYQTVYPVAEAEITPESPTNFGRILVIDNPITAGPDPQSEILGRYQGMNTYSDFNEVATNMNMNMIFSRGEYKGSTLTVFGRQAVNEDVRVLTVIGGTELFRFAQGIVLAYTVSFDQAKGVGTYLYVMYVVTPVAGRQRTA